MGTSYFLLRNGDTETLNTMYKLVGKIENKNYAYNDNIYHIREELLNDDAYSVVNYIDDNYFWDKNKIQKIKGDMYFLMLPITEKEIMSYNLTMDILKWIGQDEVLIEKFHD
jgi:hypothetical protein